MLWLCSQSHCTIVAGANINHALHMHVLLAMISDIYVQICWVQLDHIYCAKRICQCRQQLVKSVS